MQKKRITLLCSSVMILLGAVSCSAPETATTLSPDADGDGWTDLQEISAGTDPHNQDTDSDGYWDRLDPNPLDATIPSAVIPVLDPEVTVQTAVDEWARDNIAEISGEIAALVTAGTPVASHVVANLIESTLLEDIGWSIESVDPLPGKEKYIGRVRFAFPLEYGPTIVEWDPLGWRQYRIYVEYEVTIDSGRVTNSTIDTSSFRMTKLHQ